MPGSGFCLVSITKTRYIRITMTKKAYTIVLSTLKDNCDKESTLLFAYGLVWDDQNTNKLDLHRV